MNSSAKGRRQDKKSITLANKLGATGAMISAASRSAFDVVCYSPFGSLWIQNKSNNKPPTLELLQLIRERTPGPKLLLVWIDHARLPDAYLIENDGYTLLGKEWPHNVSRYLCSGEWIYERLHTPTETWPED